MPVPTHAPGCETRMWATKCPDCNERVFFFSCTCGSKVFFDAPTPPWPRHQDRCIPYLLRVLRDIEQRTITEVRRLVECFAKENDLSIPKDVYNILIAVENRDTGRSTILDLLPDSTETAIVGSIISVNRGVNFFKRLGYPENPISRGVLGDLASKRFVEVMIRKDRDPETGFCYQVTCYYSERGFDRVALSHGKKVIAYLKARRLPNDTQIWIATEIYPR